MAGTAEEAPDVEEVAALFAELAAMRRALRAPRLQDKESLLREYRAAQEKASKLTARHPPGVVSRAAALYAARVNQGREASEAPDPPRPQCARCGGEPWCAANVAPAPDNAAAFDALRKTLAALEAYATRARAQLDALAPSALGEQPPSRRAHGDG